MTDNVIVLSLDDPDMQTKLAQLSDKMLEWAAEILYSRAELMKGIAQVLVRVETGSLRDSIRIEQGGQGRFLRAIRVRAGGYVTNPKTGRLVDYAAIVEAKQPFMLPAWLSVKGDIEDLMKTVVTEKANSE